MTLAASALRLALLALALLAAPTAALANLVTNNGVTVQTNMPQAQRGVYYSYQFTPTGNEPYSSYGIISGALPQGISLDSAGLVSGIYCGPNVNGSYKWDLQVFGTNIPTGSASFVGNSGIQINMTRGPSNGGACAPAMSGVTPNGAVGVSYSGQITATPPASSPEVFTFAITSGSLPAGLSLDPTTGAITGTPTTPGGPYVFTVTATGNYGSTSS